MKIATIKLYLTAPRVRVPAGNDLPSLLVAVRQPCYRGFGIFVDVRESKSCRKRMSYSCRKRMSYYRDLCRCQPCRALRMARFEAARIAQRAVDKYQLINNGGYLHVFRAPMSCAAAARARLVRDYLVRQFRRAGFEVHFVGDGGQDVVKKRR